MVMLDLTLLEQIGSWLDVLRSWFSLACLYHKKLLGKGMALPAAESITDFHLDLTAGGGHHCL